MKKLIFLLGLVIFATLGVSAENWRKDSNSLAQVKNLGYNTEKGTYNLRIFNYQSCDVKFYVKFWLSPVVEKEVGPVAAGSSTIFSFALPYGASKIAIKPQEKCSGSQGDLGWLEVDCPWSLPAHFGSIEAKVSNGDLLVNFSTETEANNDHFIIEGSKDGNNWSKLTEVKSKAVNGNSSSKLDYSVSISPAGKVALGASLFAFLGLAFAQSRRIRLIMTGIFLLSIISFVSCFKNSDAIDTEKIHTKFIRIWQVDIDNKKEVSKVITVVKQ